jgi:basic membrane lipoprotein Med (substrate-binding protein (PBP1-ABC) superfamily)
VRLSCAALLAVALTACVSPAVDDTGYLGKAGATAAAAVSASNTALLAVQGYQDDHVTSQALEVTLQQSEDALGSVTSTFDSVQPPHTTTSDDVRQALDDLLAPAQDALSAVRIAARRGQDDALRTHAAELSKATKALEQFAEEHPA